MKSSVIRKLKDYFLGKPCSIFVQNSARPLTEQQFADYFVGIINEVEEDGIFTTHAITNCKNFFPMEKIIAICEEQMLYPDNPEHAKVISNFKRQAEAEQQSSPTPAPGPYVDIPGMEAIVKKAEENQ